MDGLAWGTVGGLRKKRSAPMVKGIFRTSNGWVQVDYGAHSAPIPRYQYEVNGFQPPFDNLPFEADYRAAEKKAQDNAKGS